MIADCIDNYIKHAKYLLIAMGVIYLFLIVAFVVFIEGITNIINAQSGEIYRQIAEFLTERFAGGREFALLAEGGFWQETFSGVFAILRAGGETSAADLMLLTAVCALIAVSGVKMAEAVTSFFYKREFGDENTRYGMWNWLVKFLIGIAFSVAFSVFTFMWEYGGWAVAAVYLLVNASQTLYTTWFVYFSKQDRRQFGRPKNVLKVVLIMLSCYAVFALLFVVLYRYVSSVIAAVVAIPLFVYTDLVILITTRTCFKRNNLGQQQNKQTNEPLA